MNSVRLQPPSQDVVKNKLITFMSTLLIVVNLYVTCYILFSRTVEVDMAEDAGIEYGGEDGSVSMRVVNRNQNYNQCVQEFMDSIIYEVKPTKKLKNGNELTITARCDEALTNRCHVNPIQTIHRVKVKDLPERFVDVNEILASFLSTLDDRTRDYLNKNMEQILNEDFTSFFIRSQPELVNQKQMYRVFLDGKKSSAKDKIINIYTITAKSEINTSSKKETLGIRKDTACYMITYSEISTSLRILDENMYGEKLVISESNDLTRETQFTSFMRSEYKSAHGVQIMKSEVSN